GPWSSSGAFGGERPEDCCVCGNDGGGPWRSSGGEDDGNAESDLSRCGVKSAPGLGKFLSLVPNAGCVVMPKPLPLGTRNVWSSVLCSGARLPDSSPLRGAGWIGLPGRAATTPGPLNCAGDDVAATAGWPRLCESKSEGFWAAASRCRTCWGGGGKCRSLAARSCSAVGLAVMPPCPP